MDEALIKLGIITKLLALLFLHEFEFDDEVVDDAVDVVVAVVVSTANRLDNE